jgi:acetoacetate decarboxylase
LEHINPNTAPTALDLQKRAGASTDIAVKGSWIGLGRLHLIPHVDAPVADFPVRRIVGAHHLIADVPPS